MLAAEGTAPPQKPVRSRLPFDPADAVARLRRADRKLAACIDTIGSCLLATEPTSTLFGGLARAIVYQQLSTAAAATIHRRALALPGGSGPDLVPAQILGATDNELRDAGLSRPKQLALRDLADRVDRGALPTLAATRRMNDAAIIEQLTQVRGIGVWSAQMFLIFRLGRPDVLPGDDLGVRKGFAVVYGCDLPTAEQVLSHGERWRPYRTVASWYLWQSAGGR
nr:DNA-3-methyladenine glycosylase 2 family protein [Nocardia colli]